MLAQAADRRYIAPCATTRTSPSSSSLNHWVATHCRFLCWYNSCSLTYISQSNRKNDTVVQLLRSRGTAAQSTWKSGLLTGLASATFSTLAITLGARRIGRDAAVDWMEVGTVLLRDGGVRAEPGWREITAGIAVHQSADIFWATTLFGPWIGKLRRRRKAVFLATTVPWAVLTSAIEYYLILPWLQPVLRMQVPYWTALTVHLSSGAAYPLFFLMRERAGDATKGEVQLGRATAYLLGGALGAASTLALLAQAGYELPPWRTRTAPEANRRFLRHMTWHHEVGARLSRMAITKAAHEELRMLGRLMLAEHETELDAMRAWWQSWYAEEMAPLTAEERMHMAGMPPPEAVDHLEHLSGVSFERQFLPMMIDHHKGAIKMADAVWRQRGDPCVLLLADSIRHAQRGQIARMEALQHSVGK